MDVPGQGRTSTCWLPRNSQSRINGETSNTWGSVAGAGEDRIRLAGERWMPGRYRLCQAYKAAVYEQAPAQASNGADFGACILEMSVSVGLPGSALFWKGRLKFDEGRRRALRFRGMLSTFARISVCR